MAAFGPGQGSVLPLTNGIWFWGVLCALCAWTLVRRHGESPTASAAPHPATAAAGPSAPSSP
jgi:DHA1 family bicyclomycin/chloramphenicol resistance-like MFS transporter